MPQSWSRLPDEILLLTSRSSHPAAPVVLLLGNRSVTKLRSDICWPPRKRRSGMRKRRNHDADFQAHGARGRAGRAHSDEAARPFRVACDDAPSAASSAARRGCGRFRARQEARLHSRMNSRFSRCTPRSRTEPTRRNRFAPADKTPLSECRQKSLHSSDRATGAPGYCWPMRREMHPARRGQQASASDLSAAMPHSGYDKVAACGRRMDLSASQILHDIRVRGARLEVASAPEKPWKARRICHEPI